MLFIALVTPYRWISSSRRYRVSPFGTRLSSCVLSIIQSSIIDARISGTEKSRLSARVFRLTQSEEVETDRPLFKILEGKNADKKGKNQSNEIQHDKISLKKRRRAKSKKEKHYHLQVTDEQK